MGWLSSVEGAPAEPGGGGRASSIPLRAAQRCMTRAGKGSRTDPGQNQVAHGPHIALAGHVTPRLFSHTAVPRNK